VRLVVLDTNILVSASITPVGPPAKIITDCVFGGMVHVVTSPRVAAEYREVMRRTKFHRYGFPLLWLESLIEESMRLPDPTSWPYVCPDPKDTPFIALSHGAGAWLVTGNARHFPESIRNGVTVLSPADYLAHILGEFQP
jgi:uncharacterized protein